MKKISLRGVSSSILALCVTVVAMAYIFIALLLSYIYRTDVELFGSAFIVCGLFLGLPLAAILCIVLHQYCIKIEITANGVLIMYPGGKRRLIESSQISAMGRISLMRRNGKYFFCVAPKSDVLAFFRSYQEKCRKIIYPEQIKKLSASEEGQWAMAVAVFARYDKTKRMVYLNQHSDELLNEIAQLLEQKVINTGFL